MRGAGARGKRLTAGASFAVGVGALAVTGIVDWVTGPEVRLFPLYVLPIAIVAWRLGRGAVLAISALSAVTWWVANAMSGTTYSAAWIWPFNCLSQLLAFGIVGLLVSSLRERLGVEQALSRRDPLTGLANSRAFRERAELLLAVARRARYPVTLAYLDLDNFKHVNDTGGHKEGDRALKEVANVLTGGVRASDVAARVGGDEFVVMLLDAGETGARHVLERLRAGVAAAMAANRWPITVSIGGVAYASAPPNLEEAIRRADALMYRAKQAGKDVVHVEVAPLAGDAAAEAAPDVASPAARRTLDAVSGRA